jgi:hypothetical protein
MVEGLSSVYDNVELLAGRWTVLLYQASAGPLTVTVLEGNPERLVWG